jgi:putative membrane protein
MMKAAQGGQAEVALGQLAQAKATDSQVKAYGQMLVTDHSKANDDLMSIARTKSVTLPSDMSAAQKSTKDRLDKQTGAAFDRAFMNQMVRDHQNDIKEFEQASKSSDPDVKAFAEKALPTLRHHLEEAQRIVKTLGAGGKPDSSAGKRL